MAEDSLQAIVEAERELLATLAEERERVAEWLAAQRTAIDRENAAQWASFREACQLRDKAAREKAAHEAAAFREQSHQSVTQFAELDDAILERVVVRHLRALLPPEGA